MFSSDVALIKGFLEVDNGDPIFTGDTSRDIVLEWQRVGVHDSLFVEPPEVNDGTSLPIFPNHKDRPTSWDYAFNTGHPAVFASSIECFVDGGLVAFRNPVSSFGFDESSFLEREFHPIFLWFDNAADAVLPKTWVFGEDVSETIDLFLRNVVSQIDVDSIWAEVGWVLAGFI
jgi:hypothetical protein